MDDKSGLPEAHKVEGSEAASLSKAGGKWNFSMINRRRLILKARLDVSGTKGLNEFGRRRAFRMMRNPSYSRNNKDFAGDVFSDLKVRPAIGFNSITASETFSTADIHVGRMFMLLLRSKEPVMIGLSMK